MPLTPGTLAAAILTLTDSTNPGFVGFPLVLLPSGIIDKAGTNAKVASNWSNVALTYFTALIQPTPTPAGLGLAQTAFQNAMAGVLAGPGAVGAAALDAAFSAFATTLATNSFPTPPAIGVVTPPIGPPGIALMPLPPVNDPRVPATSIAGKVDAWARTGLVTPPTGTPTPWA